MKRLLIAHFFASCLLVAGSVYAQTATTNPASGATRSTTGADVATPDTNQLKQYVGSYTVATGDIRQIIVTLDQGRLVGEAVGLGQSNLLPDPTTRDAFTVPDPNGGTDVYATVQFGRDAAGKVSKVLLKVQGVDIEGTRTN